MKKYIIYSTILLVLTIITSCNETEKETAMKVKNNLLLEEWTGAYGGTPAFDKMNIADLKPAIMKGMELKLAEIEAITSIEEEPTFENTILALDISGAELNRVFNYYGIWSANMSSPEFREIQGELTPILSEFETKIIQNKELFKKIKTVYNNSLTIPLEAQEQRTTQLVYERFAMQGADLDDNKKAKYGDISKQLSTLYNDFGNNVLADEEGYITYLDENQLSGLSEGFIKSAAKIAGDNGEKGKYAITNSRSSMDPFLTYSTERELRKTIWTNYYSRGDNGDDKDNNQIVADILKLRKAKTAILGFDNFAEWRLQNRMAKTPENAMNLMMKVWPAAIARVKEEVTDMQSIADENGDKITIEPWDYRFYAEKVRVKKYDLNSDEVKQYLQMEKLTQALFFTAGELFNYAFTPLEKGTVSVFHEDVNVWEVTNKESGKHIGLWYLDPYARPGKRSGAWATTYRDYTNYAMPDGRQNGEKTVLASNNSNFVKPAPGEPTLISWDDAETFFHEFGHALHFLSANVKYPTLQSGVRDYTEFQSQLLERWLSTDKVINQFLVHQKTGEPMPADLIQKIKNATTFNQGFSTTEYLASAIMDMKYHLADPINIDIDAFEKATLKEMNMPKELVMRHRTPHFGHVFSGEGYATAYYGYMWADVLTSDAAEAFAGAPNGYYDKELAGKLVDYLFSPRNALDPAEAYRLFRGRDAKIEALMRDKGFPVVTE